MTCCAPPSSRELVQALLADQWMRHVSGYGFDHLPPRARSVLPSTPGKVRTDAHYPLAWQATDGQVHVWSNGHRLTVPHTEAVLGFLGRVNSGESVPWISGSGARWRRSSREPTPSAPWSGGPRPDPKRQQAVRHPPNDPFSQCFFWSRHPDLNRGPTDYESVALPTELCRRDACRGEYHAPPGAATPLFEPASLPTGRVRPFVTRCVA